MVGVDADKRRVKASRPVEQCNYRTDRFCRHVGQRERNRLPALRAQSLARAEHERAQIVAACYAAGLDFNRVALARFQHFNKRHKKVVYAVAQLLDVGVLVGRALVAVHAYALLDAVAAQVELLAKRLHYELLQIARKQQKPVFVRQNHHVFFARAASAIKPHQGKQHRGVFAEIFYRSRLVHKARAKQERVGVYPLQGGGQKPYCGELARPAADPVPHREKFDKIFFFGVIEKLAANPRRYNRMAGEVQACVLPLLLGLEHRVAWLGSAARLRRNYRQCLAQFPAQLFKDEVEAVGVGVVEEKHAHLVGRRVRERVGDELGAESRAADADAQNVFKLAVRAADFARMDFFGKLFYVRDVFFYCRLQFESRCKMRGAQPVVADLPVFVGVCDCARN